MRCSIHLTDIKCYQCKLYKKQIQERESEGKNAKINDNYNAEVIRVNRVLRLVAMRQIKNRLLERQKALLAFFIVMFIQTYWLFGQKWTLLSRSTQANETNNLIAYSWKSLLLLKKSQNDSKNTMI